MLLLLAILGNVARHLACTNIPLLLPEQPQLHSKGLGLGWGLRFRALSGTIPMISSKILYISINEACDFQMAAPDNLASIIGCRKQKEKNL
jgi:hypothetical protein